VVHLKLKMSADGITPRKNGVVAMICELADDDRVLLIHGVSPAIRIITVWGKESIIRDLSFLRNRVLHLLSKY
jgi:hypothetical protein